MIRRFRRFEVDALAKGQRTERQLVVAVTANGSDCNAFGPDGFDKLCPKPLSVNEIYHIVTGYFQ